MSCSLPSPRADPGTSRPGRRRWVAVACLLLGLLAWTAPGPACAGETGRELLAQLKRALKRGEVPERVAAVNDAGRLSGHLERDEALAAAKLLRRGLETEPESEVRRLMVRALARYKLTHAWLPVIWASQGDRDPAVKAAARQEVLAGGADYLEVVATLLREETSAAFRAEVLLLVGDRRRHDAVPLLIGALEDESALVRAAAAEALEAITGEALGYDPAAWKLWHVKWLASRPPSAGPSVAPDGPVPEPVPCVTRGLRPRFYGLPLTAKDIVFVIDISGSVGSGGVDRAKRQLSDAVALLGSDVRIAALFFSESTNMWRQGTLLPATPANKEDLLKFLRGLKAGSRTDVYSPLNAGLTILADRVAAKQAAGEPFREPVAMITVSDGRDNVAAVPPRVIADKLDRLDPRYAVLHAVVLGARDSPLLAAIARLGGGHYVRAERD